MKFIAGDKRICYPVGESWSFNKSIMNKMAATIKIVVGTPKLNIFCTGGSGGIMASYIASKIDDVYDVDIFHYNAQTQHRIFPDKSIQNFHNTSNIIVDDFVCTGKTIDAILAAAKARFPKITFSLLCVSSLHDNAAIMYRDEFEVLMGVSEKFALEKNLTFNNK